MFVDLFEETKGVKVGNDLRPGSKTFQPFILVTGGVDIPGFVEDVDLIEPVPLPDLKVIEIVGGVILTTPVPKARST